MKYNLLSVQLLLIFVMSLCLNAGELSFRVCESGEVVTVPVIDKKNGLKLVPFEILCSKAGYVCSWDAESDRLTCTKKGSQIVFMPGNQFYTVNGVVCLLSYPPQRLGGGMYLSLSCITNEIRHFSNGTITLDTVPEVKNAQQISEKREPDKQNSDSEKSIAAAPVKNGEKPQGKIIESSSKYTVSSVSIDKKQNGTLVSLVLSDSLPFDYTYFYPNLTINFLSGKVDTAAIRQKIKTGFVDSVFSVQYKKSAQVSIILNREIEDPLLDYIQDSKTLLIALRQKKFKISKSAMAKKVETGVVISQSLPIAGIGESSIKTIVIDPGHGGKDPGAIGITGVNEKDVVLSIACKLRDLVKKQTKLKVLLTRDKDVFIPLADRTKFANDKKADLFISIHADAVPGNIKRKATTKGYKIYFLSQAKNEDDKLVAMRENAVIELEEKPQNYSNLQNVLIDLAGNEFLKESQDMCILLDQKFEKKIGKKISKLHLGVGQANFWVLNGAYMPSVLVETGFLSNDTEEKLLSTAGFQNQVAQAICDAVIGLNEKYENGI